MSSPLLDLHKAEQERIAKESRGAFLTSATVDPLGRPIGADTTYDTDPSQPTYDLGSVPVMPEERPAPPEARTALPPTAPAPPSGVVAPTPITPGGTGGGPAPVAFSPILEQPAGLSREAAAAIAAEQARVAAEVAAAPPVPPAPLPAVPEIDAAAAAERAQASWVDRVDQWVSEEILKYRPVVVGSSGALGDAATLLEALRATPERRQEIAKRIRPPGEVVRGLLPFAPGVRPESEDVEAQARGREVGAVVAKLRGRQALTPEEADLWRVTQRQITSHLELPDTVDLVGFGVGAGVDLGAAVKKAQSARYMRLIDSGVPAKEAEKQATEWADAKLQEAMRPGGVLRGVPLYVNGPVADFGEALFDAAAKIREDRQVQTEVVTQIARPYLGDNAEPIVAALLTQGTGAAEYSLVTVAKAIPQTRITSTGDVGAAVTKLEGPLAMLGRALSLEDAAWAMVVTRASPGSPEVREFLLSNRSGFDSGPEVTKAQAELYDAAGFEALAKSMEHVPEPVRGLLALAAWTGPMLGPFQALARAAEAYNENPEDPTFESTVAFPTLAGAGTALVTALQVPDPLSLGMAGMDVVRAGPRAKAALLSTALGRKVAPYFLDMDPGRIMAADVIAAAERADIRTEADVQAVAGKLFNTPGVGDVVQRAYNDRTAAAVRDKVADLGVTIDPSLAPDVTEATRAEAAVRKLESEAIAARATDLKTKIANAQAADQAAMAAATRAQAVLDAAPTSPAPLLDKRGAMLRGRVIAPDTVAEAVALADRVAGQRFPLNVSEGLKRLYRGVLGVEAPDKSARELAEEIAAEVPLFQAPPTGGLTAGERAGLGRMLLRIPGLKGVNGDAEVAGQVQRWATQAAAYAARLGIPAPPDLPTDLLQAGAAEMRAWHDAASAFKTAATKRIMETTGLRGTDGLRQADVEARGAGAARGPLAGDVYIEDGVDRWIRVDPGAIADIRAAVGGPQPPPPGVEAALRVALADVGRPVTGALQDALVVGRRVLDQVVDQPGSKLEESLRLTEEIARHQTVIRAATASLAPGAKIPAYDAAAVAAITQAEAQAFSDAQAAGFALQTAAHTSGKAVVALRAHAPALDVLTQTFTTAAANPDTPLKDLETAGKGLLRAAESWASAVASADANFAKGFSALLPDGAAYTGPAAGARAGVDVAAALLGLAGRKAPKGMPDVDVAAHLEAAVQKSIQTGAPLKETLDFAGPVPPGGGLLNPGDLRALAAVEARARAAELRRIPVDGTPAEIVDARAYFEAAARRVEANRAALDVLDGQVAAVRAAVARKKLTPAAAVAEVDRLVAGYKRAARSPIPGDAAAAIAAGKRAAKNAATEVVNAGTGLLRARKTGRKAALAHHRLATKAVEVRRGHDVAQARDAIAVAIKRRRELAKDASAAQKDLLEALVARDAAHEAARMAEAAVDLGAQRKDILLGAIRDVLASADAWDAYRAKHPGGVMLGSAMVGGQVDYDRLRTRLLRVAPPEVMRDWATSLTDPDTQQFVQDLLAGGRKALPSNVTRYRAQEILDNLVAYAESQVPGLPEFVYGAAADLAATDPFIVQPRKGLAKLFHGVARLNDPISQMHGQLSQKAFDLYRGTQTFLGMAVGELDALRKEHGVDFPAMVGRYLQEETPLDYHVGGNLLPGASRLERVVNTATRRLGTVATQANRGRAMWNEAVDWITRNPDAAREIKIVSGLFRAYVPDAFSAAAGTQAAVTLNSLENRMLRFLQDNPKVTWEDFLRVLRNTTQEMVGGLTSRDVRAFSIAAENVVYGAAAYDFTSRAQHLFDWAPYPGTPETAVEDARSLTNRVHQLLGGRGEGASGQPRTVMRDLEEALGLLNAWGKGVSSGTMRFPDEGGGQGVEILVRFATLMGESGGVIVPMHLLENLTRRAMVKDAEKYPASSAGAGIRQFFIDATSIGKSLVMTGGFLFRYGHLGGLIAGDFGTVWNESGFITAGRVALTNTVAVTPVAGVWASQVAPRVLGWIRDSVRRKTLPPGVAIGASPALQAILQGRADVIRLGGEEVPVVSEIRHMMDHGVFETSFQADFSSAVKTDAERWFSTGVTPARVRAADVARLKQSALTRGLSVADAEAEAEAGADVLAAERAAEGNPGRFGRVLSTAKQIAKSRLEQTRALAEEMQRRQRMAYYLILRDEGASPTAAGKAVREAQLDYANGLTRWEQSHWLPKLGMWYRWWRLTLTQTARIVGEPFTPGFGRKVLDGTARFPRMIDQVNGAVAIPGIAHDWRHEGENDATKAQYAYADLEGGPLSPGRHLGSVPLTREERLNMLARGYGELDGLTVSMPAFSAFEALSIFVDIVAATAHGVEVAASPNKDFDPQVAEVLMSDFMTILLTGQWTQALIKQDSFGYDWVLNSDQIALTRMLGARHLVSYNAEGQPTLPGWAVWLQSAFLANFALGSVPRFLGTYNFLPQQAHPLQRVALATASTFGLQVGGVNSRKEIEELQKKMLADIVAQAEKQEVARKRRPRD